MCLIQKKREPPLPLWKRTEVIPIHRDGGGLGACPELAEGVSPKYNFLPLSGGRGSRRWLQRFFHQSTRLSPR